MRNLNELEMIVLYFRSSEFKKSANKIWELIDRHRDRIYIEVNNADQMIMRAKDKATLEDLISFLFEVSAVPEVFIHNMIQVLEKQMKKKVDRKAKLC